MTRRSWRDRSVVVPGAALLALVLSASGCLGVPDSGDVVSAETGRTSGDTPGVAIDPRPPRSGMGPAEIVDGFLEALLATPLQTQTAGKFLTPDAQKKWDPSAEVLVYSGKADATAFESHGQVALGPTWRIDARGVWQGAVTEAERSLSFDLVSKDGQWRISRAPDALVVPDWWFEGRYSQLALYYFNSSETMLVPEPVFVPRGDALATVLVRDLLAGPSSGARDVVHSLIPPGVGRGLSVPVSADGVAEIDLTGDTRSLDLDPDDVSKMTAQLAWTLRQDPEITQVRLSIGGDSVVQHTGSALFGVATAGPQFDPAGYQSTSQMFALRGGRLVAGTLPQLHATPGPFGERARGLRSVAVNLRGTTVAGVSGSGATLWETSTTRADAEIRTVLSGAENLLNPSWDGLGRLWMVDRTRSGARFSLSSGSGAETVVLPGLSGANVRDFLVSRDGTRVLAVVRSGGIDRVMVVRIGTSPTGQPRAVGSGAVIGTGLGTIDDLAWSSPTSVTVLHRVDGSTRVTVLPVDGAGVALVPGGTVVGTELASVVGSPVEDQPTYGMTRGGGPDLVSLSTVGRDERISAGVTALTYAG